MTTLIAKAFDKLSGKTSSTPTNDASARKDSPNSRSIPPEPVQQQPEGDFRHQEQGPALQTLNLARANKRSAGLDWDNHLGGDAEKWAEQLAAHGGNADAETTTGNKESLQEQGECVYVHQEGEEPTYETAVQAWLKEETLYNGEAIQDGQAKFKGYTQCMWGETKHVGIGKAKASNGTWYVVARFTPAGNITGQKPF